MNLKEKISSLDSKLQEIDESKEVIVEFCRSLQAQIFKNTEGEFFIEPGFNTTLGLEYKVIVRIPKRNYQDVFFRFFAPSTAYPVILDLWDEQTVLCHDEQSIEQHLSDFLDKPGVLSRLRGYHDIAIEAQR